MNTPRPAPIGSVWITVRLQLGYFHPPSSEMTPRRSRTSCPLAAPWGLCGRKVPALIHKPEQITVSPWLILRADVLMCLLAEPTTDIKQVLGKRDLRKIKSPEALEIHLNKRNVLFLDYDTLSLSLLHDVSNSSKGCNRGVLPWKPTCCDNLHTKVLQVPVPASVCKVVVLSHPSQALQARQEESFQSCPWQPRNLLVTDPLLLVGTCWAMWAMHTTSRDLTAAGAGLSLESWKSWAAGSTSSSSQSGGWTHPFSDWGCAQPAVFFFSRQSPGLGSPECRSQGQPADSLLLQSDHTDNWKLHK